VGVDIGKYMVDRGGGAVGNDQFFKISPHGQLYAVLDIGEVQRGALGQLAAQLVKDKQ
jgi:hypothetical protein